MDQPKTLVASSPPSSIYSSASLQKIHLHSLINTAEILPKSIQKIQAKNLHPSSPNRAHPLASPNPNSSCSILQELQLSQYVPALKEFGTLRLLQQVYHTMKIQYLSSIIPFYDFSTVEKICLDAVKHRFIAIHMKIDHMEGVVSFGNLDSVLDYCSSVLAESYMRCPPPKRAPKLSEVLPCSAETFDEDRRIFLAGKSVIEKMKVEKERRLLERDREEELKRIELKKIAQEAEQQRIASEHQRILKEMAKRNIQEAQALQKLISEEVKGSTKLIPMDKIRQREKKYQKLDKTMDRLERAKREESAPLIEAAYQKSCQQGLLEVKECHNREQQIKIQLTIFKDKVMDHKRAEFERRKAERKEHIVSIIEAKKKEREAIRKKLYYLRREEERLVKKLHEEEAKKQKQLEEKQSLRTPAEPSEQPRPIEPAVAPSTGTYVVKHQTTEDRPSQTSNDTWRRNDERKPSSFGWSRSSSSTWSSTRRRF